MAKYDPLRDRLKTSSTHVEMTFDEVSDLVSGLPVSAYQYLAWWANEETHIQSAAWLSAGYRAGNVNLALRRVRFVKE